VVTRASSHTLSPKTSQFFLEELPDEDPMVFQWHSGERDAELAQKLANFSLLLLHSHRNAWANLHLWGQPNTCLAPVGQTEDAGMPEVAIDLNGCSPSEGQAMWACTAQGNQAKLAGATLPLRAHLY
jgi:hypothetical protein